MRLLSASSLALVAATTMVPAPAQADSHTTTMTSCRAVPYDTQLIVHDIETGEVTQRILEAGFCDDLRIDVGDDGARFILTARQGPSLRRLLQYESFQDGWEGVPVFETGGSGEHACVDRHSGELSETNLVGRCAATEIRAEYGFLSPDAEQHFLFLEDPHICAEVSFDCANTPTLELLDWAARLMDGLSISQRAQNPTFSHGLIPTEAGLATLDRNGPFEQGISVQRQVAEFTPFGSPIFTTAGDTILELNGELVFDRDSYIILSIEHGMRAGYEEPYTMLIERDGVVIEFEGHMAFHRGTFGSIFLDETGQCRVQTRAALSSALNEATLYTAPLLACTNYDLDNGTAVRRHECEFALRQLLAAYRQWCPEVARYASIAGAVFMPGRQGAESIMARLGLRRLGRLAAPLAVELLEETARVVATFPPGVDIEDNWNSAIQQISFGVLVGRAAGHGIQLFSIAR